MGFLSVQKLRTLETRPYPSNKTLTKTHADNSDREQSAAGIQVTPMGEPAGCMWYLWQGALV